MKKTYCFLAITLVLFTSFKGKDAVSEKIGLTNLRCEYQEKPLGIDERQPMLMWNIDGGPKRAVRQTAYQILVATSENLLDKDKGDLWNSGKVNSSESMHLSYEGKPLSSRQQCFWKVRIWDQNGSMSHWSTPSSWGMGILSQEEWKGQWIQSDLELFAYQKELRMLPCQNMETEDDMWDRSASIRKMTASVVEAPAVWMRKEFKAGKKTLTRATLTISGLGLYEAYLNGEKINDHLLTIAPHDFGKTVPYHVHDVREFIRKGGNAIGVILGNGYFNPVVPSLLREYAADFIDTPRLRCELLLEYADGTTELVPSDASWKFTTAGPIRFNSIRAGETYDARMELGTYSQTGFDDRNWSFAQPAAAPAGRLRNRTLPPVRVVQTIPAVGIEKLKEGFRFDIGVESTGWARLKLHGKAGQKIVIRYPGADSHTLGRYQTCEYICKGEGDECFEPRFAFNGYRYIEVFGLDYTPALTDLTGCQVVSDLQNRGAFSCSDERINNLHQINRRTIRNYNVQMPLDPVREKVCWTQDVQTNFETSAYNYNMYGIYYKWQDDFIDAIHANGYVPTVVPSCFDGPTINGPWWGGMLIYNPWQHYNFYGDRTILVKSYEAMKKQFAYLGSIAENNIISWGLGDWMDIASGGNGRPKGTTVPFTSTSAYMMYADILRQTALLLDQTSDAEYFTDRKEAIRKSINKTFYNGNSGVYDLGSQTAYLLALKFNMMDASDRPRIIENFRKQIVLDKNHLSTGFVGTPFLLTLLNEQGLGDLAWKIATQETYPSWYDMIYTKNNSVFKENWQGGLVQMPSLAGPIGAWFYRSLGGIRPESPGFKSIIIQPYTETLDWVNCTYNSPYGLIESNWQKKDGVLTMHVVIPANTTATVYVPGTNITESNVSANSAKSVHFSKYENGCTVFKVESGKYSFKSSIESLTN